MSFFKLSFSELSLTSKQAVVFLPFTVEPWIEACVVYERIFVKDNKK